MRTVRLAVFVAVLTVLASALMTSSAAALDIETEVSLPDAEVGIPYTFQLTATEGCLPYHFYYKAGSVPGLVVTDDGKLTGTPTAAGTFTFWVEVDDSVTCAGVPSQGQFTLVVAPHIEITATTLPGAKIGVPYKAPVTATGGGTLEWSVTEGTLPPGLSLNRIDGTISGTPSTVGSFPFTVKVKDDKRKATQSYTLAVAAPLSVQPSVNLPVAEVGVPLNSAIGSTGGIGPLRWSIASGSLPGGLSLDGEKGVIKGTPASAGAFSLSVSVTDSDGQATAVNVKLTIARRLAIATARVASATVGRGYSVRLVARGGVAPVSWKLAGGTLPRGLSLDRATGTLRGVPRAAGKYRITLKLTDKLGAVTTRAFTLTVARA